MTLSHVSNLLLPLTNAIAFQSWEDAEDLAREISRMSRLKRLQELQAVLEAVRDKEQPKVAPGSITAPNSPFCTQHKQVNAGELLETIADPAKAKAAQEAGWDINEAKSVAKSALPVTLETRFDETGHEEKWRNTLASELNSLLLSAKKCSSVKFWFVACSLAARVAQFEEIRVL